MRTRGVACGAAAPAAGLGLAASSSGASSSSSSSPTTAAASSDSMDKSIKWTSPMGWATWRT